jgi:hypothetical protein
MKIPEHVKRDVQARIEAVAEKHLKGKHTRLGIRFKGEFCYCLLNNFRPWRNRPLDEERAACPDLLTSHCNLHHLSGRPAATPRGGGQTQEVSPEEEKMKTNQVHLDCLTVT